MSRHLNVTKGKHMSTKKAFDLSRNSIYVADPTTDLRIVGGKRFLTGIECGDLDTADDESHALWDQERLEQPLADEFVANIHAYGVLAPILITKDGDVATVVAGRQRVRAARAVNAMRKKRGEPPITVECKMRRDNGNGLMGAMIAENEARRNDEVLAKMAKARAFLARGVSEENVAATFAISTDTLKGWLAFEDNATAETKKAVNDGRVSATAAAELARVRDPEKQSAALTHLLVAPGRKTVSAARKAVKSTTGKGKDVGVGGKRDVVKLLNAVMESKHPSNISEKSLAWWQGVEDALKIVAGESGADERLIKLAKDIGVL